MIHSIEGRTKVYEYSIEFGRAFIEGRQPLVSGDSELETCGSVWSETKLIPIEESMSLAMSNNVGRKYLFENFTRNDRDGDWAVVTSV